MDIICKFCQRKCRSLETLERHLPACKSNPNYKMQGIEKLTTAERALSYHYQHLYRDKYRELYYELLPKFRENFPRYISIHYTKREVLNQLIAIDEPIQIENGVWSCPICGLHIKDMGAHVEKVHELSWEVFIDSYNWKDSRIFCDANHRANLSANKLHYYNETEEGAIRKKLQSIQNSGENNPACRDEVKLKISNSRKGKCFLSKESRYNISKSTDRGLYSKNARSYGYMFWAMHNSRERRFRSKVEYLIFLMLKYYKIEFDYEPYKLEYFDREEDCLRHYIIDFTVGNRIFEVKPSYITLDSQEKYVFIREKLKSINKKLEWLTPSNFYDTFEIAAAGQKPLSFFEGEILRNIKEGNCKLKIPVSHDPAFYLNSKFMKSLGDNPEDVLKNGEILYENKKNNRN